MPKFNADSQESLFEPIEVTIEEKAYTVVVVTPDLMDKMAVLFKEVEETQDMSLMFSVVGKQLGLFLGVKPEVFRAIDMRKLSATVKFIVSTITGQSKGEEEGKKLGDKGKK